MYRNQKVVWWVFDAYLVEKPHGVLGFDRLEEALDLRLKGKREIYGV